MSEKLLTVNEVAERLQIQKETVRVYIKKGLLKALEMPNGRYRVKEESVDKFLHSK
jgi:excisionase family DNA binding protein